jgi:predicted small secreted protein
VVRCGVRSGGLLLAAVVLAATTLAACGDNDGSGGDGTEHGTTRTTTHQCAWAVRADKQTLNIAYPDTAATYWGLTYDLAPGEYLELHGRFPSARYMSLISYGPVGGAIDVLTDRDVVADHGSVNPFATGGTAAPAGGSYTVTIRSGAPAATDRNTVRAGTPEGTTATTTTTTTAPRDAGEVNRLGSGHGRGVRGSTLFRVYLPRPARDRTGGAGLPKVTLVRADGSRARVPTCARPGPSRNALAVVQRYGPATDSPAPNEPTFIRPAASSARLYPDPDNVYIATILHHRPGWVAVIRAKAPTFPDPVHGRPIGDGEQVRYWSMCTNEYRKPYPVTTCKADEDTPLDSTDRFTYVISTPSDRPANATAANGVTWLDWGSTRVDVVLLLRNMLASPTFSESAINVKPGSLPTSMGDYAPRGVYCTKQAFEQRDASCAPPS